MANRWMRGPGISLPQGGTNFIQWERGKSNGATVVITGMDVVNGNTCLATSTDLSTWTVNVLPMVIAPQNLAWNGTAWCVVGGSTNNNRCYTSPDGLTWTERTMPDTSTSNLYGIDVAFGTNFVAYHRVGTVFLQSVDNGVTWTTHTAPATSSNRSMGSAWNGTTFCIALANGNIHRATNANTWTVVTRPVNGFIYLIPGTTHFGFINDDINERSTDSGVTWTTYGTPTEDSAAPAVDVAGARVWYFAVSNMLLSTDLGVTPKCTSIKTPINPTGDPVFEQWYGLLLHGGKVRGVSGAPADQLQTAVMYEFIEEPEPDFLLTNEVPVIIDGSSLFHLVVPEGVDWLTVSAEFTADGRFYSEYELMMSYGPYNGTAWDYLQDPSGVFISVENPMPGTYYGYAHSCGEWPTNLVATGVEAPVSIFWTGHRNTEET